jgi:hypothetical protein
LRRLFRVVVAAAGCWVFLAVSRDDVRGGSVSRRNRRGFSCLGLRWQAAASRPGKFDESAAAQARTHTDSAY